MKRAAIAIALGTILSVSGKRAAVRRHLPDFEGQSIALNLTGLNPPFIIAVHNGKLGLDESAEPGVEIEGDLKTFLDIFFGRLDYDAAFFRGRISFHGSLPLAMRFKALFDHISP